MLRIPQVIPPRWSTWNSWNSKEEWIQEEGYQEKVSDREREEIHVTSPDMELDWKGRCPYKPWHKPHLRPRPSAAPRTLNSGSGKEDDEDDDDEEEYETVLVEEEHDDNEELIRQTKEILQRHCACANLCSLLIYTPSSVRHRRRRNRCVYRINCAWASF